jgi:hypothetical protein
MALTPLDLFIHYRESRLDDKLFMVQERSWDADKDNYKVVDAIPKDFN